LRLSKKSITLIFILVFPIYLIGQLKYVGENRGAISFSGSYGKIGVSDIFGAQFDYSSEGKIGVGFSYLHSETLPRGDGFGFQIEYAISRPKNTAGLGINLLGSFTTTWAHTTYATPYYSPQARQTIYSVHESTIRSNSFIGGFELYLQTLQSDFNVEPFIQLARTFSKVSATNYSENLSRNSIGIGTDFIIRVSETNLVVIIPGLVFQEHVLPALIGNISFCHTIN